MSAGDIIQLPFLFDVLITHARTHPWHDNCCFAGRPFLKARASGACRILFCSLSFRWKGAVGVWSRPVKAQFAPRLPQIEFRNAISMVAMIAIRLTSRCGVFWWNSNAACGCGELVQFAQNLRRQRFGDLREIGILNGNYRPRKQRLNLSSKSRDRIDSLPSGITNPDSPEWSKVLCGECLFASIFGLYSLERHTLRW